MYIFQIPTQTQTLDEYIIGLIDSSGSMGSNWEYICAQWNELIPKENTRIITFSNDSSVSNQNTLLTPISSYENTGTNLFNAFEKLEDEINAIPVKNNVTVIFLSDGQDTNDILVIDKIDTLKGCKNSSRIINFITVGIGKQFPQNLAIKLRQKYHNGDETMPVNFPVESSTMGAFKKAFENFFPFVNIGQKRSVKPGLCVFPWKEHEECIAERKWVISYQNSITIDNEELDLKPHFSKVSAINDLFYEWTQMMSIEFTSENESAEVRAKSTFQYMKKIIEEHKKLTNFDIFAPIELPNLSIFEKAQFRSDFFQSKRIVWIFENMKKMAEGSIGARFSTFEEEMTKSFGKTLDIAARGWNQPKIKNLTPKFFNTIIKEFKGLLKILPVKAEGSNQQLRNLLRDPSLTKMLDECKTPIDLYRGFQLFGHPVKFITPESDNLKKTAAEISKEVKPGVKYINFGGEMELFTIICSQKDIQVEIPKTNKKAKINSVIPLFDQHDSDLAFYAQSKLFKLLIGYSLNRKTDQFFEDALLDSHLYLFKHLLEKNQFIEKDNLLKVIESVKVFKPLIDSEHWLNAEIDNKDLSALMNIQFDSLNRNFDKYLKALFYIYDLKDQNHITDNQAMNMVKTDWQNDVWSKVYEMTIQDYFKITIPSKERENLVKNFILEKIRSVFFKIRTLSSLTENLIYEIAIQIIENEIQLEVSRKKFQKRYKTNVKFENYLKFGKLFGDFSISDQEIEETIYQVEYNISSKVKMEKDYLKKKIQKLKQKKDALIVVVKNSLNQVLDQIKTEKNQWVAFKIKTEKKGRKYLRQKMKAPVKAKRFERRGRRNNEPVSVETVVRTIKNNYLFKELHPILIKEFTEYFRKQHSQIIPQKKEKMQQFCAKKGIDFSTIEFNKDTFLPIGVCGSTSCYFYLHKYPRLDTHLKTWDCQLPKGFHKMVKDNCQKNVEEIYEVIYQYSGEKTGKELINLGDNQMGKTKEEILKYIKNLKEVYQTFAQE